MTEEELRALIRCGEDQGVEFKAAEADAADIARAIVAMANSGGGTLLLGQPVAMVQRTAVTRRGQRMPPPLLRTAIGISRLLVRRFGGRRRIAWWSNESVARRILRASVALLSHSR